MAWRACCYFILFLSCLLMGDRSLLSYHQSSLHGDVDWALLSSLSVWHLCPCPVCALTADSVCPWVWDKAINRDDRSIDQAARRAAVPLTGQVFWHVSYVESVLRSALIRSNLTTVEIRLWSVFRAPEVVVDCSCDLNRVVNCRHSVEFVTVNSLWTQSELLSGRQRSLSSVSVYLWTEVVSLLIASWWLGRPSTASLFAVGE